MELHERALPTHLPPVSFALAVPVVGSSGQDPVPDVVDEQAHTSDAEKSAAASRRLVFIRRHL